MNNAYEPIMRSLLFVPAHVDKFFDKAIKSEADALILDLEDSVPEDKKMSARNSLRRRLVSQKFKVPILVRINARATGLLREDIEKTALPAVQGFVVPKVINMSDIAYVDAILQKCEKRHNIRIGTFVIFPLIETAEAVLNVLSIARSSKRIRGLIFGHEDYLHNMRALHTDNAGNLLFPRTMIAMAARAAGCCPIDTPYLDIKNLDGCAQHVKESRAIGFSGMLVLHPMQIDIANKGYAPSQEEVARAKRIVSLNQAASKNNRSIVFVEGKFIAPPILKQAELILRMSEMIRKKA